MKREESFIRDSFHGEPRVTLFCSYVMRREREKVISFTGDRVFRLAARFFCSPVCIFMMPVPGLCRRRLSLASNYEGGRTSLSLFTPVLTLPFSLCMHSPSLSTLYSLFFFSESQSQGLTDRPDDHSCSFVCGNIVCRCFTVSFLLLGKAE